jgi:hypothetical protein
MYKNSRNWIATLPNEFLLWKLKLCRCFESLGQRCKQQHCLNWDLFISLERSWNTNIKSELTFFISKFEFLVMATRAIALKINLANWLPIIPRDMDQMIYDYNIPYDIEMFSSKVTTLPLITFQLEFKYGNYEPTKLRDS